MWTTMSFMGSKFGMGSILTELSDRSTVLIGVLQARPVTPLMFMEHEPQIAERHERRNEIDPSTSAWHIRARRARSPFPEIDLDALATRLDIDGFVVAKEVERDVAHALNTISLPACIS
jgi:hypothetical protein